MPSCEQRDSKCYRVLDDNRMKYLPTLESQLHHSDKVFFKKLHPNATLPQRSTSGSIGFDVQLPTTITIPPKQILKIPTGLSSAFPNHLYLRIADRSSLAFKNLTIKGGVVDSDYRGDITIMMQNDNEFPITFTPDQRVAQFIFERASVPQVVLTDELPSSTRNGGFGSTNTPSKPNQFLRRLYISPQQTILYSSNKNIKPLLSNQSSTNNNTYLSTLRTAKISTAQQTQVNHHRNINDVIEMTTPSPSSISTSQSTKQSSSNTTKLQSPLYAINKSLPVKQRIDKKYLEQATGSSNIESIIQHMPTVSTQSLTVSPDVNPILDWGQVSTINSNRRNTKPSKPPPNYSDVWHMDIGYGPCASIGGYRYTLLLVDKSTRFKFIYGLTNLKDSLQQAFKKFFLHCGSKPKLVRCDFDPKFMGKHVQKLFQDEKIQLQAAPPRRQHQNGLVERHWASLVKTARTWLTSSLLPTKYWWFAIKRAAEISNILKAPHKETPISPYELVTGQKPDYRQLFPMFSIAYMKYAREEKKEGGKWKTQSLKVIAVGTCPNSDSLLFYHPPSKQLFSTSDGYKFDYFYPAGPQFDLPFDGTFIFTNQTTIQNVHHTPTHEENKTVYINNSLNDSQQEENYQSFVNNHSFLGSSTKTSQHHYQPATVLSIPIDETVEPYILQIQSTGEIVEIMSCDIKESDPNQSENITNSNPNSFLPWVRHNSKATLFLSDKGWRKPQQGYLIHDSSTDEWYFQKGRSMNNSTHPKLHLPNFLSNHQSMINNKKLFHGWQNFKHVISARYARATSNLIAYHIIRRHVSAQNLHSMVAPVLSKHHKLSPNDRKIWDDSYAAEYEGLVDVDTWQVINEQEYQLLKRTTKITTVPTMAISVIKKDGEGKPVRAKYRIVALGNLDTYLWTKQDCFAPVLTQLELRLLISIAAKFGCIPRQGDVSQAFCQAFLPPNEKYVCIPPSGCPITPPNSYWLLQKTLYGLKRSPRHWYNLAKKLLLSLGLQSTPHSPCIFHGRLDPTEEPIYIGLYVDDLIYFSKSTKTIQLFEQQFGDLITTTFNGEVDYFLGIKFTHERHSHTSVTIHLSQQAYIEDLIIKTELNGEGVNEPKTPYRSGYPVDNIPTEQYPPAIQEKLTATYQFLIGSLNWLAVSTRPDISTITNLLAQYMSLPSKGHIYAARNVIRYLKGTKNKGISFRTNQHTSMQSFIKFPIDDSKLYSMTDANWGPQDQSSKQYPTSPKQLELFKTRSLSGYILWHGGPLHWLSKRQSITARSSTEAEIYATDECVKQLQHISFLLEDINLQHLVMPSPTTVLNDNNACVVWSHNLTTKGLRHVQIRENAIRESIEAGFVQVHHVEGAYNLADMFTKEEKSVEHFVTIRDKILSNLPTHEVNHQSHSCQIQGGVDNQGGPTSDPRPSITEDLPTT